MTKTEINTIIEEIQNNAMATDEQKREVLALMNTLQAEYFNQSFQKLNGQIKKYILTNTKFRSIRANVAVRLNIETTDLIYVEGQGYTIYPKGADWFARKSQGWY